MISDQALRQCLAERWDLPEVTIQPNHHGGMNSATWLVHGGRGGSGRRWVAKAVAPAAGRAFAGGLAVAAAVDAAGIPAGAPAPTRDGRLVAVVDGVPLGLLRWVPGAELSGMDVDEQRTIGRTLAQVHAALWETRVEAPDQFHWLDLRAAHLSVRPWIRDRVAEAVAAYEDLGPRSLSYGLLHTDPAPEAFRQDPETGACGLIDWGVAMSGPLLYDLASAVMYVGGPDRAGSLLAAYLGQSVLSHSEVELGLPVLLRFRWAVQADYFARRIATRDLTGIASDAENEAGLAHARHALGGPLARTARVPPIGSPAAPVIHRPRG